MVLTRLFQRRDAALFYAALLVTSVATGTLTARNQQSVSLPVIGIVAVCGAVVMLSIPAQVLFLGWLFVAPFLQVSAGATSLGRALVWGLYVGPALMLVVLTVMRRRASHSRTWLDVIPAVYVAYVFGSLVLTHGLSTRPAGSLKAFFEIVALGAVVYYFLTSGPGADIPPARIATVVLAGGAVQGGLALVERASGWNLWNDNYWHINNGAARAVSTLDNPAVLGAYLGVTVVVALAVLGWGGPRHMRRLAAVALVLSVPGLLVTLTRGPILATAVVASLVLVLGPRTRLIGVVTIAGAALVLVLLLPAVRSSELYQQRVADRVNVEGRLVLQKLSFQLAAKKPIVGWGYGSFDRVKQVEQLKFNDSIPVGVLGLTSHDTYLTNLVELGGLGLLLLLLPWTAILLRAIKRMRISSTDRWLLVAGVAAVFVIVLTATTVDFRFFSFAETLPWVFLAIVQRTLATPG